MIETAVHDPVARWMQPAYEDGLRRLLEAGAAFPFHTRPAYAGWLARRTTTSSTPPA